MLEKVNVHDMPTASTPLILTTEHYILCIEDARPVIGLVRDALRAAGYKVVSAAFSHESLTLMRAHKPNVLVVDLTTRDAPGWSVYQELKQDKNLADIAVIDVSARSPEVGQSRVDDFPPAHDYAPQPADIERLVHSIKILAQQA